MLCHLKVKKCFLTLRQKFLCSSLLHFLHLQLTATFLIKSIFIFIIIMRSQCTECSLLLTDERLQKVVGNFKSLIEFFIERLLSSLKTLPSFAESLYSSLQPCLERIFLQIILQSPRQKEMPYAFKIQ